MQRTVLALLTIILLSSSALNAQSILSRKELTKDGQIHYIFTNTNVNLDDYDTEYYFQPMSAREIAQANAIAQEDRINEARERIYHNRRMAEIERTRRFEQQAELNKALEKINRLGKKYSSDSLITPTRTGISTQPRSAIDVTTGQFMPGVAGGVIDPRSGTFYHDVGGGYVNTRTGTFSPKIGP